jgi:TfoX/Sxy family transcriptional regulator of competence genes
MPTPLERLQSVLEKAASDLPGVTWRRMFGCDAVFARGAIFGLVWKLGRIGVRIPDPKTFGELMATPGASPWTAGNKTMSNWVLVPTGFHDDAARLRKWVREAHRLAAGATPKPASKAKTPAHKPRSTAGGVRKRSRVRN